MLRSSADLDYAVKYYTLDTQFLDGVMRAYDPQKIRLTKLANPAWPWQFVLGFLFFIFKGASADQAGISFSTSGTPPPMGYVGL